MMQVGALVPYARNSRTHAEWQIVQIANSISEFGFVNPILVASDCTIIAGHGRLMAAQHLGLEEVPVIVLDHLTDTQRRALVIADNKIAENAGWDEVMLREELAALSDEAFDMDLLGFSTDELEEIMQGVGEDDAELPSDPGDPDHVPEPEPIHTTEPGDVWLLGDHRLMCGDSTNRHDVDWLVGDELADACWTDPPYNVDYEGSAGKIQNDNMEDGDFRRFLTSALKCAFNVLAPGAPIYIAHADTEGLNFRAAFRDAGFKLSGCLIWEKPSLVLGRSDYQWRHEPILYGWRPGAAHPWYGGRANTTVFNSGGVGLRMMPDGSLQVDMGDQTVVVTGQNLAMESVQNSVIHFDKPKRNAEHPTMKPVGLIVRMLENSTAKGDSVLDLFGGSGSTLIACEETGRRARLMELDPKFCDVIVARWQTFTGKKATREVDGLTFDKVRAARKAA